MGPGLDLKKALKAVRLSPSDMLELLCLQSQLLHNLPQQLLGAVLLASSGFLPLSELTSRHVALPLSVCGLAGHT